MTPLFDSKKNLLAAAVASGILYLASQFVIMKILEPLGSGNVLRFQLTFDEKSMADLLWAWGQPGMDTFKSHFYLDFIHPFLYGSFMFFTMLYIRAGLSGPTGKVGIPGYCYLPPAAAAFDLAENGLELALVGQYPDLSGALVFITALVSACKWALAGVSLCIIVVTGARLVLKTIRARRAAS
jgi:hypothetical protein